MDFGDYAPADPSLAAVHGALRRAEAAYEIAVAAVQALYAWLGKGRADGRSPLSPTLAEAELERLQDEQHRLANIIMALRGLELGARKAGSPGTP